MDLGGVSDPEALQRLDEQTGARNREIMQTTYQHHRAIQARCFHPTGKWEEFKPEAIEQSIVARFDQMVARYPTRLAVKMGAQQLTYTEFNRVVNQLAHAILATRPAGAEPVVFLLEQGIQAIVAIMAIIKTGKFYAALEPSSPQAHLQRILADTQATLVLTNQGNLATAQAITTHEHTILLLDELPSNLPTTNPAVGITPDSFAYLMYTSGSTGVPKGVIENHRDVLHFSRVFTNVLHISVEDRLGLNQSNSFSAAVSKIFPALLNGACLCPFDPIAQGIAGLVRWLQEEKITYWFLVPSLFRQFIKSLTGTDQFPHLRLIGLGSDRILPADIALYQQHLLPSCILRVGYGLSEVKTVTYYFVDHTTPIPDGLVPIGYCVDETDVLVVDEQGKQVETNTIGELVIKSRYVAPGYWRQPALTEARFRPDPLGSDARLYTTGDLGLQLPDGCLVHVGRKDFQVKIRGVRIETSEVEQAIAASGWFKEVLVVGRAIATDTSQGEQQLVAYLVPAALAAPTTSALRSLLATSLPASMIPAAFIMLDALPLNANQKIDRGALPAPTQRRPLLDQPYVAPRTAREMQLVRLWSEALAIEPVGIYDHFLDLGGNSLQAMQIIQRVLTVFQVNLPLTVLFEAPTIAAMAASLTQSQATHVNPAALEQLLTELEALSMQETARVVTAYL